MQHHDCLLKAFIAVLLVELLAACGEGESETLS